MVATSFVSRIQKAGFHLALHGDALEVSPASSLTDEQRRFIRTHKPALVAELKATNDPTPPPHPQTIHRAAEIIAQVTGEFRLDPIDVWGWLSVDDIKAIAREDAEEVAGLRAYCQHWAAQGSNTSGDHALPWPLEHDQCEQNPVRCRDCRHRQATQHPALIDCGAGRQGFGGLGLWWNTDAHHCERFQESSDQWVEQFMGPSGGASSARVIRPPIDR
jgi:hypothetical protein